VELRDTLDESLCVIVSVTAVDFVIDSDWLLVLDLCPESLEVSDGVGEG